jgi:hypothetical protein
MQETPLRPGCRQLLRAGADDSAAPAQVRPRPCPARPLRGACRHRFPRSHGPSEHEVKAQWLTPRCPANPSPSGTRPIHSGPWSIQRSQHARGTRAAGIQANPQPGRDRQRATHEHRRTHPGSARASGARTTEGTRAPQKSTRIGLSGREGSRLACREGIGPLAMTQASKGDFADRTARQGAKQVRPPISGSDHQTCRAAPIGHRDHRGTLRA